jgi:predicted porin
MKKLLLTAALTLSAGIVSAQNVTVYGQLDAGYGVTESTATSGGVKQKSSGIQEAMSGGNRLGFRGTEDLGGGAKAEFVIETAISLTQSSNIAKWDGAGHQTWATATSGTGTANGLGTSFNRQSYIGLSNNLGTLRLGYQYTDAYLVGVGFTSGFEPTIGGTTHLNGLSAVRANMVTYQSPKISNFTVGLQHGTNATDYSDSAVTDYDSKITSVSLRYDRGAFSAAVAVNQLKSDLSATADVETKKDSTVVAASYDFGRAKVFASYGDHSSKTSDNSTAAIDYKNTYVGVAVPFGKNTVFAQAGKAEAEQSGAKINDRTLYQVGVKHDLSKRTMLFAVYGSDDEKVASTTKYDWTSYRVGMRHSF